MGMPYFFAVWSFHGRDLPEAAIERGLRAFQIPPGLRPIHRLNETKYSGLWSTELISPDMDGVVRFGSKFDGHVDFCFEADGLRVSTDWVGVGLFYFLREPWGIAIASEVEPLIALKEEINFNIEAVRDFIALGFTLGETTLYQGIEASPVGAFWRIGREKERVFSSAPYETAISPASSEQLADRFFEKFRESVQGLSSSGRTPYFLLDGGADSRLLLSALAPSARTEKNFLCEDLWRPGSKKNFLDRAITSEMSRELGLNLTFTSSLPADPRPQSKLFRLTGANLLSGRYGGELLGGWGREALGLRSFREQSANNLKDMSQSFLGSANFFQECRAKLESLLEMMPGSNRPQNFTFRHLLRSFLTTIHFCESWRQPHYFLLKRRTPFISPDLAEVFLSIPFEKLRRYELYRLIFRRHAPDLMAFPINSPLADCESGDFKKAMVPTENAFVEELADRRKGKYLSPFEPSLELVDTLRISRKSLEAALRKFPSFRFRLETLSHLLRKTPKAEFGYKPEEVRLHEFR